ncbi:uncharacterized protein ACJ7VT_000192 [Polymixia lowei]
MDDKDSLVKGGVSIIHRIREGKHQYEVQDVVKFKKGNAKGAFARKGDSLMLINGTDLQDLTPEEFAQVLSKGNPMLTFHEASQVEGQADQTCSDEDTLHPISKEGQEGDLLIIALTNTSITVVKGRGCDSGAPCQGCAGNGCTFKDVVMVTKSTSVTLVSRGSGSFKQEKQMDNISIEHALSQKYLRSFCLQGSPRVSPNPENITIYYYKSDCIERTFRGTPVVLNFTDSNCFLKCCKDGERVVLQVETCEKQKLKKISRKDEGTLSFVFYMKATRDRKRKFESALCHGWFIHILDTETAAVGAMDKHGDDPSFFFIIQK